MNIPQDILDIHKRFQKAGKKLFVVGGGVRDHLMGLTPKDFDMATDAMPNEIEQILYGYDFDFTGKSFGVMRVYTAEAPKGYEIATFRRDITTGRNPTVELGVTIDVDVMRRDLTINALFFDIDEQKIVDLVGGMQDIANRKIKTPGNPKDRFNEDKLRILRAIRFAARFDFQFDDLTWNAIEADHKLVGPDKEGNLVPISQERIADEFIKGVAQCNVNNYLNILERVNLFEQIFPGIEANKLYEISSKKPEVVIAALFHDADRSQLWHQLVYVCHFPIKMSNGIIFLLMLQELNSENAYRFKRIMDKNDFSPDDILEYAELSSIANNFIKAFCQYEIKTTGEDLMKEGYTEGIELGNELKRRERAIFEELLKIKP